MSRKEFTGRHMAILMVSFFGIVIAVNLVMATFAVRTFGGTVVDNSYVASQRFNSWLEVAREQADLQWTVETLRDPTGHLVSRIRAFDGQPLSDAVVEVKASHPLGRAPERLLVLQDQGEGYYRSSEPLADGRWIIRLQVRRGGQEARYLTEVAP